MVPLLLSSSCVTRKKTARKKKTFRVKKKRGPFARPFFSRGLFTVTFDGMSERATTRSLQFQYLPRFALLANMNFWGLSAVSTATWSPNEVLNTGCTVFLHTTNSLFFESSRFLQISLTARWWQYVDWLNMSWISCRSSSSSREVINDLSAMAGLSSIFLSMAACTWKRIKKSEG